MHLAVCGSATRLLTIDHPDFSIGDGFYALSRVGSRAGFVTLRQTFVRRCHYDNANAAAGYFHCTDLGALVDLS